MHEGERANHCRNNSFNSTVISATEMHKMLRWSQEDGVWWGMSERISPRKGHLGCDLRDDKNSPGDRGASCQASQRLGLLCIDEITYMGRVANKCEINTVAGYCVGS